MPRANATAANSLHVRKQDFVRSAIWDAAIDLFAAGGFEATTIDEIAKAAGVSTRTFFRYFASKADLMGQGMVEYRTLLTQAVKSAPPSSSPLQVVRHTVERVATAAAAQPRVRDIVKIASTSVAAREAQLSRRAEVEDGVTEAFAARYRTSFDRDIAPRLLAGLTLSVLDVTFRVWSKQTSPDILPITEEVFSATTALFAANPPSVRTSRQRNARTA
jgi:AcrR family transcriptional regulator